MKLVFATHNQNKFKEVQAMMPPYIELLSLSHIDCNEDIAETETTIEGNAILKAKYVKDNYGYDCFADDTGLEVTALNNEPGVYSARYAGSQNDAQANMQKLLLNLSDKENREARFKTAISLIFNGKDKLFLGICEGEIVATQKGKGGFGYDPIFKPKGFNKTFAEMSLHEKSEIGHRGKAIRQLIDYLSER
jgi:XTP/dITP diphosphohydrolase